MILSKEFLDAQPLLQQLERAHEEKILKEFISDYVGWVGTIEDIYKAQKQSSIIEERDIDHAIRDLRREGLLKEEDKTPYRQLCDMCELYHKESPELVKEYVNDLYFAHVGEPTWDTAYDNFMSEYVKDPEQFFDILRDIRKEERKKKVNESLLNEFLSPSRLKTVGKILAKDKNELESDEYSKKLKMYQGIAKQLGVKDVNSLLVYTQDKATLRDLIKNNLPKTKIFSRHTQIQVGDMKADYYGDWGIVVTSNAIYFKNDGAFKQLDKFLEGSRDRMPLEDEIDIEETESSEEITATTAEPDRLAAEEIHIYKTKSGNYYAKVAQAPEVEQNKDFTDPDKCIKFAKGVLDKKGYKSKNFKVEKHYDTAPEVKKVAIGGKNYKASDIAFVVNGKAYSYTRYTALPEEDRTKAVVVARKGLINQEIVEDFWNNVGDAEACLAEIIIQLPENMKVEFDGCEYLITNSDNDNYARGYVVAGDQLDKEDYIYNICKLCSPVCRRDELLGDLKEVFERLEEDFETSANYMTVQDMLAGLVDNVSDAQIDDEIKRFRKFARTLGVKNYDEMIVLVSDEFDPAFIFDNYEDMSTKNEKVRYFTDENMICEYANGNYYIYFATEDVCKKFYDLAERFMSGADLDENPFNEEYIFEEGTLNIEECLNKIDKTNNNKYDLLNCYLENVHSRESREKIATMIKENVSAEELHTYLRGTTMKLFENDETNNDMSIEEFLQEATAVSDDGELTVVGESMLNRACNWLDNEGFEFDTKELDGAGKEPEFLIKWNKKESDGFEYSDEQNADNKRTALNILGKVREVEDMLLDICQSVVATKMATIYDSELQDLLREALELANTFKY